MVGCCAGIAASPLDSLHLVGSDQGWATAVRAVPEYSSHGEAAGVAAMAVAGHVDPMWVAVSVFLAYSVAGT